MKAALRLLLAPYRFSVDRLFRMGEVGWAHWFDSPSLYPGGNHLYLYKDSAGTTPTTAVGDTIGLSVRRAGTLNLSQATGTARPTLSARVNALLNTEDFNSWNKSRATVTVNATTAPNGTLTADKIVENTDTSTHRVYQVTTKPSAVASAWVFSVSLKAAERGFATVVMSDNSESDRGAYGINLTTGAVSSFFGTFTNPSITVIDQGDGWWRVTLTVTCDTDTQLVAWVHVADSLVAVSSYTGDGTSGIYAWGADLRTADDAAKNIPAYQRVGATAADHDTDGFPHGQYPDGTDDNQTTTTGGGGTTGFFYCGAITVSGGAGTARTIWSDTGTNTGYRVRINSSNKLELAAGNGSAYTTVASNETITAPGTYILSAWDDGGVLAVQVNNFAAATTTRPSVSAGTSTATMYKDNGAASSYLNGRDYGSVYRQSYIGESQHARLKRWLADRARITL